MEGFIHAEDGKLVDGRGEPLILRGVGLGNWLLPEGYMWKFASPGPQSPHEIEALVVDLIGVEQAEQFWRRFRDVFITEKDVARIHAEGMNHIRLPINWRVLMHEDGGLIESGFELIDRLIGWCRAHELWVVLDLHGAPGGQTGTHIDDSLHGKPELFSDDSYRALTIELWRSIARRYRDETAVAAYDLLNEPLPDEYQHTYEERLRDLYVDLTAAIRDVDPNHVITYEGSHWATNWSLFTDVWDRNSLLQFHKYWSPPDRPSIQPYIDAGRRLGLPIYMGEGGENHLDWIQTAFQLYDDCAISWNFWPWKKVNTRTSPCSVVAPVGWQQIVDFAAGRAIKPTPTEAWTVLAELLDAMAIDRCDYRSEVVAALFRRPPVTIPAVGFGFRGAGRSYRTFSAKPLAGFRSDDHVTIQPTSGRNAGDLDWRHSLDGIGSAEDGLAVSLGDGEWVAYDFEIAEPTAVEFEIASADGQLAIEVSVDGVALVEDAVAAGSVCVATKGSLAAGSHVVRITGGARRSLVRAIDIRPERRQAI
jgi:endoglucanase